MNRETVISEFVTFLIEEGNWETSDRIYLTNRLLFLIGEADFLEENVSEHKTDCSPVELVDELVKIGQENKRIDESEYEVEALRGQLMDLVTPSPSQVNQRFNELYEVDKEEATRYFFELSQKNDYIKTREIARNIEFPVETEFGNLDITINLSKPEKDPKQIASSLTKQQSDYPKCMLCLENEGYAGRSGYPNRFNHRVIRTQIDGNEWGFQYSPYAYYNEHSIIFSKKHEPMVINRQTFQSLLGIIDWLPHYFVGSNADIPIVGGSILSHNHYQAGRFTFPLEKSEMRETFTLPDFSSVEAGIVNWPMSVIRLRSENKEELIEVADFILSKWRSYSDEDLSIVAKTSDGVNHHTITPIARKRAGK
ncbi:MAG: UDP-glucose--hexose-1-phosphate uridylyltransferase, partial [Vagococcus sp.]